VLQSPRDAGWSSQVARRAHNPEVAGSNPAPAIRKALETGPFCSLRRDRAGGFLPNFCPWLLPMVQESARSAERGSVRARIHGEAPPAT
jgi:hypothetical protein